MNEPVAGSRNPDQGRVVGDAFFGGEIPILLVTKTRDVAVQKSANGRRYRIVASPDLTAWTALATNLTATDTNFTFSTNVPGDVKFFRIRRAP